MKNFDNVDGIDENFITMNLALNRAETFLKSPILSKSILLEALDSGKIAAIADAILEEYAHGNVVSLAKRRTKYLISLMEARPYCALLIDKNSFSRSPKGARVIYNWNLNRVIRVQPPSSEIFTQKSTGRFGAPLQPRLVMYNVKLEQAGVEAAINKFAGNMRRSVSLIAKPKRQYRKREDYRSLISDIFALAESGRLSEAYGPFDIWGKKAKFVECLIIRLGNTVGITTAKSLAKMLHEIDESVRSGQQQERQRIDQQLTIAT